MKIYACSDLHVSPNQFSDRARVFLTEAAQEADLTLLCGDIYEGMWCELDESIDSPNGQELLSLIRSLRKAVILRGNHDWTLPEYLTDIQHPILENHTFNADGKRYYATHGWVEYDLTLSLLAPIYKWLYPLFPKLIKWWTGRNSIRMQKRAAQETGSHDARYWRRVREAANQAMFQAIDRGWIPIWGHTHHRHIDAYERWLALNCGDFDQDEIGGLMIEDGVPREWEPDL